MAAHRNVLQQDIGLAADLADRSDRSIGNTGLLRFVSFNMHGFNQGLSVVRELIDTLFPDIFLLQEHWLTPDNLYKLNTHFPEYVAIGKSAMEYCVQQGPLRGRPFGGVAFLVKKEFFEHVCILVCADRYVVIRFMDFVIINLYLPCVGTKDRLFIVENVLQEISQFVVSLHGESIVIGGDMNADLDHLEQASVIINKFLNDNLLYRCDACDTSSKSNNYTYSNDALGHNSTIDYFCVSNVCSFIGFNILEPSVNLSDHRPIMATVSIKGPVACHTAGVSKAKEKAYVAQLRWDHGDLSSYYHMSGIYIQSLLEDLDNQVSNDRCTFDFINYVYDKLVSSLQYCANMYIPLHYKGFYKFWWDQELDLLKEESIKSHNLWKQAGKPRNGPCFNKYKSDKLAYKLRIRNSQKEETSCYTNDLNDALLQKQGTTFWNCWRSKFNSKENRPLQVNNLTNESDIADLFARHFEKICVVKSEEVNKNLKDVYVTNRSSYSGSPFTNDHAFDAELTEAIINNMKKGKAAGLDGITAEHLQHCHPSLPTFLAKLFNLIMETGIVPGNFGLSYTIPLLKGNGGCMSKSLTVNDFRGISISPAISKIFENCILQRYKEYFITSDNQFGFKKFTGCSHAIYTVRQTVEVFTNSGTTVNLCALDLSKAFDKVNHFGLFIKLMNRAVPIVLLEVLEHWFSICLTCIRFGSSVTSFFSLECGVRQGGVLSPHLFNIYIDDVIKTVSHSKFCCNIRFSCVSIFMYADDLIIMSPSVTLLQKLFTLVENELMSIEMYINPAKSSCIRFGPRYDAICEELETHDGSKIPWVTTCKYLGIEMLSSRSFKCAFDNAKKSFYKSFNAIFGKIGRHASADVVIHLLKIKCLPIILYGLNACPVNATDKKSLDFVIFKTLAKIFETFSKEVIDECRIYFNIPLAADMLINHKMKFLMRYSASENLLCQLYAPNAEREMKAMSYRPY
jgi:Reverse transcriptase (RNA-dependent DNA polymerase)